LLKTTNTKWGAIVLSSCPLGTVLRIFELGAQPSAAQPSNTYLAQLVAVDEDANIVRVRTPSRTYERGRRSAEVPAREHGIPLDCVNTVYETSDAGPNTTSEWRLYFQHSR
jgi:hypothetical protein